jgi:sec-independent protein translocase protein TatB
MFDIGFSELMVIAVVALIVIGPERLPRVARTAGHLFGRLQRYVNDVKADINREIELDELRKFKTEFEQAAQTMESDVKAHMAEVESAMGAVAADASLKEEAEKVDAELKALTEQAQADPHATEVTAKDATTELPAEASLPAPADKPVA